MNKPLLGDILHYLRGDSIPADVTTTRVVPILYVPFLVSSHLVRGAECWTRCWCRYECAGEFASAVFRHRTQLFPHLSRFSGIPIWYFGKVLGTEDSNNH